MTSVRCHFDVICPLGWYMNLPKSIIGENAPVSCSPFLFQRQNFLDQASSLPASFDLLGYWNNLRRYLSRDGTEGGDDSDTQTHKCKGRGFE